MALVHEPLNCWRCERQLSLSAINAGIVACEACGHQQRVELFPAYFRAPEEGRNGERLLIDDESSCFYHPTKKAEVVCDACGRFVCALCALELSGGNVCPRCFDAARQGKGEIQPLTDRQKRGDKQALMLAALPLLMWPITIVTAPIALFLCIRHWNDARNSPVGGSGTKYAALLLALGELGIWGLVFAALFFG